MSDGNFNKALLPHTPYASWLKAGKAIARMKALEAFDQWMNLHLPALSADEHGRMKEVFASLLSSKL